MDAKCSQKFPRVIHLPEEDAGKAQFLLQKLEEYHKRLEGYKPPEGQQDTLCKIHLVNRIFKEKTVNVDSFIQQMHDVFGSDFRLDICVRVWLVISDYCLTGGEHVHRSVQQPQPIVLKGD